MTLPLWHRLLGNILRWPEGHARFAVVYCLAWAWYIAVRCAYGRRPFEGRTAPIPRSWLYYYQFCLLVVTWPLWDQKILNTAKVKGVQSANATKPRAKPA